MNERDSIARGAAMLSSDLKAAIPEIEEKTGKQIRFGEVVAPPVAPFASGVFTPNSSGNIARIILDQSELVQEAMDVIPTPDGTLIRLPARYRDTPRCMWWGEWDRLPFPPCPFKERQDLIRFPIGGDGTPGSGYTVRVYLNKATGEVCVFLPPDAEAASFIEWVDTTVPEGPQ